MGDDISGLPQGPTPQIPLDGAGVEGANAPLSQKPEALSQFVDGLSTQNNEGGPKKKGEVLYAMGDDGTVPRGGPKDNGNAFFGAIPLAAFFNILSQIAKDRAGEAYGEAVRSADFMEKMHETAVDIAHKIKEIAKEEAEIYEAEAVAAAVTLGMTIAGTVGSVYYANTKMAGATDLQNIANGNVLKGEQISKAGGIGQSAGSVYSNIVKAEKTLKKGQLEFVKKLLENMESQLNKMMQSSDERQRQLHEVTGSVIQLLNQLIQQSSQSSFFSQRSA